MGYITLYDEFGKIIKARVWQKTDTLANWIANTNIIGPGEGAFIVSEEGQPINFKLGDGTKTFSELPYWIQYDQAAYIPTYTATPSQPVAYTIVGAGTYGSITVGVNKLAVLGWDGSAWFKNVEVDLPQVQVKNEFGQSTTDAISQKIVTDVKNITDINSNSINGITLSGASIGDFKTIELTSDNLKKNTTISYKTVGLSGKAGSGVFLFRADGTNVQVVGGTGDMIGDYILLEDFVKIRFYNSSTTTTFTGELTIKSILVDINQNKVKIEENSILSNWLGNIVCSSAKNTKTITWTNSGQYWTNTGAKVANTSFDISSPIATGGFRYFGYYGQLNKGNNSIVAVDGSNNYISTIQVGELEFSNNGYSLFIFKTTASYISISINNSHKTTSQLFELKSPYLIGILDRLEENKNLITSLSDSLLKEVVTNQSTSTRTLEIISGNLKNGRSISYSAIPNVTPSDIAVFLIRANDTFVQLPSASTIDKDYSLSEDFVKIRFYNNTNDGGFSGKLTIKPLIYKEKEVKIKTLIIGDSYSQTTGSTLSNWVSSYLAVLPLGSSVKSLAVASASVKDKFTDRTTYPYTSRPTSSVNTGNLNTFGCQIEKLKRLMTGTDLDPGETKWYENQSEYPNVIIIEGGMNDSFDADDSGYNGQFTKQVTAWNKSNSGTATNSNVWIKTPMSEVNRTTFAGAYRYLVEELLTIFPDAQIYITTASRLGYWTYDVNTIRNNTAKQQRMCADLCGAKVIDWNSFGQINTIVNYPKGTGTEADPYIWDRTVGNVDTNDAMHPNSRGGKKYGRIAAKVVMNSFINLNDE